MFPDSSLIAERDKSISITAHLCGHVLFHNFLINSPARSFFSWLSISFCNREELKEKYLALHLFFGYNRRFFPPFIPANNISSQSLPIIPSREVLTIAAKLR